MTYISLFSKYAFLYKWIEPFKVIISWVKNGLFSTFSGFFHSKSYIVQYYKGALEQLQKLSCGHTPATNLDEL